MNTALTILAHTLLSVAVIVAIAYLVKSKDLRAMIREMRDDD